MKRKTRSVVGPGHGDTIPYSTSLDELRKALPCAEATISTTLPRGGLQVIQPRNTDQNRMRVYVREQHLNDIVAWEALARMEPVHLTGFEQSSGGGQRVARTFRERFLKPFGFEYCAAAPLRGPVLEGYPGVLHAFRTPEQGDFGQSELDDLREVSMEFDEVIAEMRALASRTPR